MSLVVKAQSGDMFSHLKENQHFVVSDYKNYLQSLDVKKTLASIEKTSCLHI